jgi:UMF1 family MFS transporter
MTTSDTTKNNPKIINAWCFYDWANSAFSLVIISTIFPIYFGSVVVNAKGGDIVNFLGIEMKNSALFSFSISFSFLITALLSPFLSAIADFSGYKKRFMQLFSYLGACCCGLLYFFESDTIVFGVICFIIATIGFSGSIVFYNSYLPDLVTDDQMDRISAKGFSFGYLGSVLLLLANFTLFLFPNFYGGITGGQAARLSFLSVGIWWFVFAQYSFYYLPNPASRIGKKKANWLLAGFHELQKVAAELQSQPVLKKYLIAFLFYSMGVQTVMYVATIFGEKELHIPSDDLKLVVLVLQLVAIIGASVFAKVSAAIGNIKALIMIVSVWICICFGAYFVTGGGQFFILAGVVGFVMGGVQSLSRSTYAKLIPANTVDTTSYFSFYDIVEKLSIVLGTFSYGLIDHITHNMRYSTVALAIYFMIGLLLLSTIVRSKPLLPQH